MAGSGNAWTNPTSALTDNNAGAYAGGQAPAATQLLRLRNFGFDAEVPANAQIVGVVVRAQAAEQLRHGLTDGPATRPYA